MNTENMRDALDIVRKFRSFGFKLAIDDFGSGYSSFNTLTDMVVDTLKIDREFLRDTPNIVKSRRIISSIINLTKELEIKTVAEGVGTEEQMRFLREAGCDTAQGYYFNRPMAVSDFEELLRGIGKTKNSEEGR